MKKILVVAAHPDDELLGCGGTLLFYKKKGYKIAIVFLSDGESSRNVKKNNLKNQLQQGRNKQNWSQKNANLQNQFLVNIRTTNLIQFLFYTLLNL